MRVRRDRLGQTDVTFKNAFIMGSSGRGGKRRAEKRPRKVTWDGQEWAEALTDRRYDYP
jgi:hypothetical protein